ncbi:M23 family metallopeptidase [Paeniglutamicibacter sp. MACA_103]|uniref:M23 family metallopeptidase n=1 Tax=Paeniglutamicibacter sp. MACA_103 TaxID=3377337 RepID=UPI003894B218
MKIVSALAGFTIGTLVLLAPASVPPPVPGQASQRAAPTGAWSWPLPPVPRVVRAFDPPAQRWLSGHRGADLEAGPGDTVSAPAGGIVSFAGTVVDRPVIVINHGSGLLSSFEPVRSTLAVGAIVSAHDEIGVVGTGAHCDARCLHWGLRLDGEYIDPLLTIIDTRPSILLPLD